MGILQSVLQHLGNQTDGREDARLRNNRNFRSTNSYEYNYHYEDDEYSRYTNLRRVVNDHQNVKTPAVDLIQDQTTPAQTVTYREKLMSSSSGSGKAAGRQFEAPPPPTIVRSIKHYSSSHRILLVGDGDFSFSTCLAVAFGCASNMIATSLDSQSFLVRNYGSAPYNLNELRIRKCTLMHEIDATEIANHAILGRMKFDRIVFNFPFAGFFKELPRDSQLVLHRRLVSLFLRNAREIISENGEIHISHKTNGFHAEWKLESLALSHMLRLVEAVDFSTQDYPGYSTKCGFGGDNNFNCYPSKTYKFRLGY